MLADERLHTLYLFVLSESPCHIIDFDQTLHCNEWVKNRFSCRHKSFPVWERIGFYNPVPDLLIVRRSFIPCFTQCKSDDTYLTWDVGSDGPYRNRWSSGFVVSVYLATMTRVIMICPSTPWDFVQFKHIKGARKEKLGTRVLIFLVTWHSRPNRNLRGQSMGGLSSNITMLASNSFLIPIFLA